MNSVPAVAALPVVRDCTGSIDRPVPGPGGQVARETVESIVVAIVLAFMFRGFVAEAFVIPTGSMAPTLQGRHMDVVCPQCNYQYRTGASIENAENGPLRSDVTRTRCPICRFPQLLDKLQDPNERSFNGDRILVNKFAFEFAEPQRWDVIVFKYPGDAKVNYIKRLVGLPGETIRIRHGDIYTSDQGADGALREQRRFQIARKPPDKVLALLQIVDDTRYVGELLQQVRWPQRWVPASRTAAAESWQGSNSEGFTVAAGAKESWLRYRHLIPRGEDWRRIAAGNSPWLEGYAGQLITDYYAYNDFQAYNQSTDFGGQCWVGDLAVEAEVEAMDAGGQLSLDLVEGGCHHRCVVDLATGEVKLSLTGGERAFGSDNRDPATQPKALTQLRGPGKFRLRFANVDDQLLLWINDQLVSFEGATAFRCLSETVPQWSLRDPGDFAPVGIGARQTRLHVSRLRVLRDVYYRAVEPIEPYKETEYDQSEIGYGFDTATVMSDPRTWATTKLFRARRSVEFSLQQDQFFPLGDNSPESRDARLWSEIADESGRFDPPQHVERNLLIGKAVLVYWPHAWRLGTSWLPIVPNYQRIGRIR